MASQKAKSEARAVARGERWRGGSKRRHEKILSLKVPLTRCKGQAIANFEREFDFNWEL